jgi:hypothetical protein
MRWPRVRFTIRWLMLLVAAVGMAVWLVITAVRVALDPRANQLSHLRLGRDTTELVVHTHPIAGVFWPRYWRRLLGQTWPGSFVCPSCLERYERSENRKLIDLASSDDPLAMDEAKTRIETERGEGMITGRRPAGLVAGPVTIASEWPVHDGPTRATLKRVWQSGEGGHYESPDRWLSQSYGERPARFVGIGGTRFSLVIVDGKVTPLLMLAWPAPERPEELWCFEGNEIQRFFEGVCSLDVSWQTARLSPPSADSASTLTLDFRHGFEMSYREEYHGP